MNRKTVTALLAAAVIALSVAGCNAGASPPPAHFGNCPVGQHWVDKPAGSFNWNCVR
jgi:hypothetical protein